MEGVCNAAREVRYAAVSASVYAEEGGNCVRSQQKVCAECKKRCGKGSVQRYVGRKEVKERQQMEEVQARLGGRRRCPPSCVRSVCGKRRGAVCNGRKVRCTR